MFEQAFKNIDDVLRKEAGCTTELDYTEQTSWLLFLKYLDGLEDDKAVEAELLGRKYFLVQLDLRQFNNGSSIPQINHYNIGPIEVAFPESLPKQQAIVDVLNSLSADTQRLESIYRQKLAALDELRKSILQQAFTGAL